MKCSQCGYENAEDSRFCEKCGTSLNSSGGGLTDSGVPSESVENPVEETVEKVVNEPDSNESSSAGRSEQNVLSQETVSAEEASVPEVKAEELAPVEDAPASESTIDEGEKSQGSTEPQATPSDAVNNAVDAVKNATGKLNKNALVGIGVAVVAAIAIVVFMLIGGGPSDEFVKEAIETSVSWPTKNGEEGTWKVDSIDIRSKETTEVPEFYAGLLEGDVYEYVAVVKGSSDVAEGEQVVEAHFGKYEGEWRSMGCSAESKTFTPKVGVSEDDVLAEKDTILSTAFSDMISSEREMYKKAEVSVGEIDFDKDAATCKTTVTYTVDSAFSEAEAKIDVVYAFSEQGVWKLSSAVAKPGADDVSYDKLIGTWKGAFKETSSWGSNCYGAETKELVLTIDSVDQSSLKIEGTFQGLAHYHERLKSDQNETAGDTDSGEVPFVATLSDSGFSYMGSIGIGHFDLGATYEAPENAQGSLTIAFGFGSFDDPNAAVAMLRTEAKYEEPLLLFDSTAIFEDVYTLTKDE